MLYFDCPSCWDHHYPWCGDLADLWKADVGDLRLALQPAPLEEQTYTLYENQDYKIMLPTT
jgi:hypothetical protein